MFMRIMNLMMMKKIGTIIIHTIIITMKVIIMIIAKEKTLAQKHFIVTSPLTEIF